LTQVFNFSVAPDPRSSVSLWFGRLLPARTRVFNFSAEPESRSSVSLWFGTLVPAWTRVFSFNAAPLTLPALRVVFVFIDFSPLQIATGFAFGSRGAQ
jgi:hypothetical protein